MNHLLIALAIGAAASIIATRQDIVRRHYRREAAELRARLAEAGLEASRLQSVLAETEHAAATETEALKAARLRLDAARQRAATVKIVPPDFDRDGAWPADQSYFLLAKRYLPAIEYKLFHGEMNHLCKPPGVSYQRGDYLHDTVSTLFGMTQAEVLGVEAAVRNYRAAIAEALRSHAERLPALARDEEEGTDDYRAAAYRVTMIGSAIAPAVGELQRRFEEVLGPERGSLLFAKAEPWLYEITGDGNVPSGATAYRVKIEARRNPDGSVSHLFSLGGPDNAQSYYTRQGFSYPLESWAPLSPYTGIFGFNPLLEDRKGMERGKP